jgi:Phage Terminase
MKHAATGTFDIDRVLTNRHLLGAALHDAASWQVWRVVLKSAFGLRLDEEEAKAFAAVAGSRKPPTQRVRELWAIVGRRGGKSRMAAALACYLACFGSHKLARGEVGQVLVLAASRDQARTVFEYVKGFLDASPILSKEVTNATASEITLRNGVVIAVHSNSFRTVRGRTLLAAIFDEVSFWRDESSALPDLETYRAVMPSLATTNGMLIGISTPYRKIGLLHQKFRDHFGVDGDDVLVVKGSTKQFNPSLSDKIIATQRQADPTAASSEWDAEFRTDISTFLDDELIDAAVEHGRPLELPPSRALFGATYKAFADPSGGVGADSYSLALAHKDGDHFILDLVRGTRGKFDPQQVTQEYAELVKAYGVGSVTGDSYSAQWVVTAWSNTGISYVQSDIAKSQIYRECLPLFTRGLVRLPDHAALLRELRLLERQAHRGGKESIDHPRGGHDDYANAVCGALRLLSDRLGYDTSYKWVDGIGIADAAANLTEQQRADRRKQEADDWYRSRCRNGPGPSLWRRMVAVPRMMTKRGSG